MDFYIDGFARAILFKFFWATLCCFCLKPVWLEYHDLQAASWISLKVGWNYINAFTIDCSWNQKAFDVLSKMKKKNQTHKRWVFGWCSKFPISVQRNVNHTNFVHFQQHVLFFRLIWSMCLMDSPRSSFLFPSALHVFEPLCTCWNTGFKGIKNLGNMLIWFLGETFRDHFQSLEATIFSSNTWQERE